MHSIWLVPGKEFTHFLLTHMYMSMQCVLKYLTNVNYESRHEIACFMQYANNKDT